MTRKPYRTVGLGGTFDHFHAGHAEFISCAAKLGDKLLIGVTTTSLSLGKPWPESIEDFELRMRGVISFCKKHRIQAEVFPLKDVFGPTLEQSPIQALAVTPETEKGADVINQARQKLRLRPLPVYICDYFLADDGQPLHAEHIRAGRMNRQGVSYSRIFTKDLELNQTQRLFFREPKGKLRRAPSTKGPVIAVVGDMCLENFITNRWPYQIGVFDFLQQRQEAISPVLEKLQATVVTNVPHQISVEMVEALEKAATATQNRTHIKVEGEEDLAAVALFLLLPLNSLVYYGQPGEGMVEAVVTEDLKQASYKALSSSAE